MNTWEINHFKSKEEALHHIFRTLKEDEKTIVGRGVSDEHQISVGKYQLILKKKGVKKNEK